MREIFALLLAFQVKHFLADFPLQGRYMMGKFASTGWQLPLAQHAAVHALLTFVICLSYSAIQDTEWKISAVRMGMLAAADFAVHFTVDRLKASPTLGGRWKADQAAYWYTLGQDQMAHHLTHYMIIWWLIR